MLSDTDKIKIKNLVATKPLGKDCGYTSIWTDQDILNECLKYALNNHLEWSIEHLNYFYQHMLVVIPHIKTIEGDK